MNVVSQYVRLSSGHQMPLVGFGTFRVRGNELLRDVIDESLRVGFRSIGCACTIALVCAQHKENSSSLIGCKEDTHDNGISLIPSRDTAAVYGNEEDIGLALTELLPKHNLKREDIFITTKLSPSDNGSPERIRKAVYKSLIALGLLYLDLYLIHWPGAARIPENSLQNTELRASTWKTLVELQEQGLLRSIGVSNYTIKHLKELFQNSCGVKPAVNQVECHPHYRQEELLKFCRQEGIHLQAYSSLGTSDPTALLTDPVVSQISSRLNVSPAEVLLKWALQQGIGIIPKSTKKEHIRDNISLDFVISNDQMKALSNLSQNKYAWDPKNVY